jgi:outer membrane receptor protein involved in Fe transport
VVPDLDEDPQQALFYALDGKSYSNSFQFQTDYELLHRFDVRLAYRWSDVKTTYRKGLLQKPLQSRHRAFLNLACETGNQWYFDYTLNWQGRKRIPFTGSNPEVYRLHNFSPDFFLMNAQVSKAWGERFEVYAGAENLGDYRQPDPIVAAGDPFGPYFDSSLIWGPVSGRMGYVGLRYRL